MKPEDFPQLASVEQIEQGFESHGYICSRKIATAVFLAFQLRKPVLVEGPPGVGKTELIYCRAPRAWRSPSSDCTSSAIFSTLRIFSSHGPC